MYSIELVEGNDGTMLLLANGVSCVQFLRREREKAIARFWETVKVLTNPADPKHEQYVSGYKRALADHGTCKKSYPIIRAVYIK